MQPSASASVEESALDRLLETPPYGLAHAEKSALLGAELRRLTALHSRACAPYASMLAGTGAGRLDSGSLSDIALLPVRLFKMLNLRSVADGEVVKELTSSGTSSQQVSRIAVDRLTASLQTRALAAIVTSLIGPKRLPMIIIDSRAILDGRQSISARAAGLLGLSQFGRDHFYALDKDMRLDESGLRAFAAAHDGKPLLIFGFTFMVWQYFFQALRTSATQLDLRNAILIHGGGWKKLQDQAVSNDEFKAALAEQCGITRVHSYYGMVEQVGCIHMECEHGFLHAPNMADVLVRDINSGRALPPGRVGHLQVLSALPRSYPGHSLLTDDLGIVHGIDDCPCGRLGTRFSVLGRAPQSELRGCSDTHAFSVDPQAGASASALQQFLPQARRFETVSQFIERIDPRRPGPGPFDQTTLAFLDDLSRRLLSDASARAFPEIVALAFWLRKGNLAGITAGFDRSLGQGEIAQPLGLAFHVAPSNVDTIFVYSWALSLLAGNSNIVRVSQTLSPQMETLLSTLSEMTLDSRWREIWQNNAVLTYAHSEAVSSALSAMADVRVLWGGDRSVSHLRSFAGPPGSRDIAFVDKISATVVHAERYLGADAATRGRAAGAFVSDAYQFDQLACSSPHLVVFCGQTDDAERASAAFWRDVLAALSTLDAARASNAPDKLLSACLLAAQVPGAVWTQHAALDLLSVVRIPPSSIAEAMQRVGGGFFVESIYPQLTDLAAIAGRHMQTLSYIGYSRQEMLDAAPLLTRAGIDRIVEVGKALNFSPVWDGYHLLCELTRRVVVA